VIHIPPPPPPPQGPQAAFSTPMLISEDKAKHFAIHIMNVVVSAGW
jgi:hypothetical protein